MPTQYKFSSERVWKVYENLSEDVCVVAVEHPNAFDILKTQLELSRKKSTMYTGKKQKG